MLVDTITSNCAKVMQLLNLKNLTNLETKQHHDGSVCYRWIKGQHLFSVVVLASKYIIKTNDVHSGELIHAEELGYP